VVPAPTHGWKSVFLLNAVDGGLPSDLSTGTTAEIEEERRLLYVAMTRANDNLNLIVPQRACRCSTKIT
jgi:DNA helicase-2/ATP-dependent DNA helicase PcrA